MKRLATLRLVLIATLMFASGLACAQTGAAYSLDAVVDTRFAQADGPKVLAVTPGGAAETLGLRVGDRLLGVNGVSLRDQGNLDRRLEHLLAGSNGVVSIEVLREGQPLNLSGTLNPVAQAPATGCGYVSAIDPAPGVTDSVYPLEITMIDGNSTPLEAQNRYRLTPGEHVLVTRELIPSHHFSANQARQRGLMLDRKLARAYKAIVVDIEPDTRYSLGARLIREAMDGDAIRANAYWEPVVFKQRVESCR